MNEKEAHKTIENLFDVLEVSLNKDSLDVIKEQLTVPVKKERLTYNENEDFFEYTLIKPIKKIDSNETIISKIRIEEADINAKEILDGLDKGSKDFTEKSFKVYCKDSEGKEIDLGFVGRVKDRDMKTISIVIASFFLGAAL